jgi:hypothetical protein
VGTPKQLTAFGCIDSSVNEYTKVRVDDPLSGAIGPYVSFDYNNPFIL